VFALDLLKGALPVAFIGPVAELLSPGISHDLYPNLLPTKAALCAFLGHLFPIYLRFRGGKGVATGFGTVCVLVPGPAIAAILVWVVVVLASRYVSLASLVAVGVLSALRIVTAHPAFDRDHLLVTLFCLAGSILVAVKHRANIGRLVAGTENQIGDSSMRQHLLKAVHLLALGFWFGGAGFFNFVAAPSIFESFKDVVANSPSDRTAGVKIVPDGTTDDERKALASALAGSAVGPIFPKYFAMQTACGAVALATAVAWRRFAYGRLRLLVIGIGLATVLVGWPISTEVSRLRIERFNPEPAIATKAKERFGPVHLVSLALSGVTVLLAGGGLALGSRVPDQTACQPGKIAT
jgi:glycerol-3-phosphate acyltransferase PlsY